MFSRMDVEQEWCGAMGELKRRWSASTGGQTGAKSISMLRHQNFLLARTIEVWKFGLMCTVRWEDASHQEFTGSQPNSRGFVCLSSVAKV